MDELMLSFHTQPDPYMAWFTPMGGRKKCSFCGLEHGSFRMVTATHSVCDLGMENLRFYRGTE